MSAFVEKMADSDRELLEEVYRYTYKILLAYAKDMLKDQGLAEDTVQEAFIRLSGNLDKIDSPDSKRTLNYMIVIVKNIIYTNFIKENRVEKFSYEDYDTENDPPSTVEDLLVEKEQYGMLKEALRSLSDGLRQPLVLHYFSRLKLEQIADVMKITPTNVGVRIYRAKKELKDYITKKEAAGNAGRK
ncbi:MAG: RNA polymerase sigma factor [Oscillospiraceae bacterium]